jgi:type IV pilus assembly protein PilA
MLQKLRQRSQSEAGFTLVELLVVMLIIGLLAAIAIPAFFNQRDKAKDASAKEAVRTAQTAIETYQTDNNGSYTGADNAKLIAIEPTLNDVTARLTVTPTATGKGYEVQVGSTVSGQLFRITRSDTGGITYTCDVDGKAGCPSTGNWN